MRDYTAIGTIVYNQRPDFKLFLGGVSKSLRASNHSIGAVYARDITDETIHSDRLNTDRDRRRVFQERDIGGGESHVEGGEPKYLHSPNKRYNR